MANVVDALTVTLGLDAKAFKAGIDQAKTDQKTLRDESAKTATELEARGKQAAQFFSSVKNEALGLMGVLLGGKGLESFARNATTELAALGREARNIGIAVPELAAFRNMVERNGGSAEAATSSFRNLTDEMERFKVFGTSSLIPYLSPIGGERGDSAMQTYMKFVKFAQDHKDDVPLINLIGKGLGLDQGSINTAMSGIAEVNRQLAESYKLGVPTDEMIKRTQQLQHDWEALRQSADHLGNTILTNLQPALSGALNWTTEMIIKNPDVVAAIAAIATGLGAIAAIRISSGLMGLTGLAGALASIEALAARLVPLTLPLALTGDTTTDPAMNRRPTNPGFFQQGGALENTVRRWFGFQPNIADGSLKDEQQRFLQGLSAPESGGAYDIKNGGSRFTDYSRFPEGIGAGGTSSAAGRYQFTSDTWREQAKKLGLTDFTPANQDRAAWDLASTEYRNRSGRDLASDLKTGGYEADIAKALKGRWPSLPGGSQSNQSLGQFQNNLAPSAASRLPPTAITPSGPPSSVTIGSIVVNTSAGDGLGIARDIRGALADELTTQANRGLQ